MGLYPGHWQCVGGCGRHVREASRFPYEINARGDVEHYHIVGVNDIGPAHWLREALYYIGHCGPVLCGPIEPVLAAQRLRGHVTTEHDEDYKHLRSHREPSWAELKRAHWWWHGGDESVNPEDIDLSDEKEDNGAIPITQRP